MYDLLIIGGGVNGAGIAADAAGRGLSVILCEQDDLASHTSSWSSKLIHGGLRYLEYYEFRLVREALIEREVLLNKAPHLIHPLRIIMPHNQHLRPSWMIRMGLFLYDHLNLRQSLPKSKGIKIRSKDPAEPLNEHTTKGYIYSDATVDDSRLVVTNALHAQALGAEILTRHVVQSAKREADHWVVTVLDKNTQQTKTFQTKALVNAAGPWVDTIISQRLALKSRHHVRLVKGSHLVTKKLYEGNQAYILQNEDHRIVFVIPYRNDFTLIGTTDVAYTGDPSQVSINPTEQKYLLEVVNQYFKKQLADADIVWTYSGVRPLQSDENADPSKVTRDYTFEVDDQDGKLPVISIFGGKITTYRKLAEHALAKLTPYFPTMKKAWTAKAKMPGGEFKNFSTFVTITQTRYAWLPNALLQRLCLAYGTRIELVLDKASAMTELGQHFGGTLYEREVRYLMQHEWAQTATDILWRRTKQGLYFTAENVAKLTEWMHNNKKIS
jgi:glycerol-3-phosphate dehydrogenase